MNDAGSNPLRADQLLIWQSSVGCGSFRENDMSGYLINDEENDKLCKTENKTPKQRFVYSTGFERIWHCARICPLARSCENFNIFKINLDNFS